MTTRRARVVRSTVQGVFWFLVTCAAYVILAVPSTLCKLIFGSPF
jgi:hypothetical protein